MGCLSYYSEACLKELYQAIRLSLGKGFFIKKPLRYS